MTPYHTFIGIDIGKESFVVATSGQQTVKSYSNTAHGIASFIKAHRYAHKTGLIVLEATGGYEREVLHKLVTKGIAVHRAHGSKVKNFVRSYGNGAKTDRLDALALARYGQERWQELGLYEAPQAHQQKLYELVQRRMDLKQMIIAEKTRKASPGLSEIKESCDCVLERLEAEQSKVTQKITEIIEATAALKESYKALLKIPGIGKIVGFELLAFMPELGRVNRREIASLGSVAPRANDSGQRRGYRPTGSGRRIIRPSLYLAAMAARKTQTPLADFYLKLVQRGKPKMVALMALMRKILIVANAVLKPLLLKNHS